MMSTCCAGSPLSHRFKHARTDSFDPWTGSASWTPEEQARFLFFPVKEFEEIYLEHYSPNALFQSLVYNRLDGIPSDLEM